MKRQTINVLASTEWGNGQHEIVDFRQIIALPAGVRVLAIDGHARLRASGNEGIIQVPPSEVESEHGSAALQHAMSLQTRRRLKTDGVKRHNQECRMFVLDWEVHCSAKRTGQLIGCDYRKVDKIRKIRRDGWPEIQEAVRNDEIGINKAYKLIRDVELGNDGNGKRQAAAHIKTLKTLLSEENFAFLDQLGGDVGDHVNKALEVYVHWLKDQEGAAVRESKAGIRGDA